MFTGPRDAKVLDIGSGAGKFCMIGSAATNAIFTGVEQREKLHKVASKIVKYYHLSNIHFIHANIMDIDFKAYNGFYFFNPFYENIEKSYVIDETVELKTQNFNIYTKYVKEQLDSMPVGTRLVTYWSSLKDIPRSYKVQQKSVNGLLEMWLKTE
jgi:tRNA1(Val) A37 N6-methylase TrmN6